MSEISSNFGMESLNVAMLKRSSDNQGQMALALLEGAVQTSQQIQANARNCEIFLPFFNFLKNITFWCQSTQENVYGTNKQCCSH